MSRIAVEELREGYELEPLVGEPLRITDFVRYQGASGDMNPIHHDSDFAARAGYPSPFAVGMLPAGVLASHLADQLGPEEVRMFRVRFREQAWPGDVLIYKARVSAVEERDDCLVVQLEGEILRQTGGCMAEASARFELAR